MLLSTHWKNFRNGSEAEIVGSRRLSSAISGTYSDSNIKVDSFSVRPRAAGLRPITDCEEKCDPRRDAN
jgi:hypothetical protein